MQHRIKSCICSGGGQEAFLKAEDISVESFFLILDQYLKFLPLKGLVPHRITSGISRFRFLPSSFPFIKLCLLLAFNYFWFWIPRRRLIKIFIRSLVSYSSYRAYSNLLHRTPLSLWYSSVPSWIKELVCSILDHICHPKIFTK